MSRFPQPYIQKAKLQIINCIYYLKSYFWQKLYFSLGFVGNYLNLGIFDSQVFAHELKNKNYLLFFFVNIEILKFQIDIIFLTPLFFYIVKININCFYLYLNQHNTCATNIIFCCIFHLIHFAAFKI